MTDPLWRDDDYEPAVLPSPSQLLHPEFLQSAPTGTGEAEPMAPPPIPPTAPGGASAEPEPTRFLPRRRPIRFVIAAFVTAAVFGAVSLVVAAMSGTSSPKGVGLFFATIGTALAGIVAVVWVWRWAGRRVRGIPTKRSRPVEVEGEGPFQ